MGQKILLLGHKKVAGLALAAMAIQCDLEPLAMGWEAFSVRLLGRRNRPALVLANTDRMPDIPLEAFCLSLRQHLGASLPILAATASRKFQDTARLLDAGFSDCLPTDPAEELFRHKIVRWLERGDAVAGGDLAGQWDEEDEPPTELLQIFAAAGNWPTLGDLVKIHSGAAVRSPGSRRMARPNPEWKGVLTADVVDRFSVGKPAMFFHWNRFRLFRLPDPAEYAVREKVLLRRAGPPLVAAVDRSGLPAGPDVHALVPKDDIPAGFIACLLNSRLADFYFNRLAANAADAGRLRPEVLRRLPVPAGIAEAAAELARTASLLAHFGQNPRDWVDRQRRDELWENMEETVFSLYGVTTGARRELAALHF